MLAWLAWTGLLLARTVLLLAWLAFPLLLAWLALPLLLARVAWSYIELNLATVQLLLCCLGRSRGPGSGWSSGRGSGSRHAPAGTPGKRWSLAR